MRVRSRVAVVAAAAIFGVPLCTTGAAFGAELPRGPVTAQTVASAQAEATAAATASTNAARAAADAQVALDAAKAKSAAAATAAQAAADAAAANPTPDNQAAAAAAQAAAIKATADQATAQTDFNNKSAASATAAAASTAANDNATREAASFARLSKGTSAESADQIPETDAFPDNAVHSDNVQLVDHVRGVVGTDKTCPAYNPTKCPGYSSLNFLSYENLGYDVMVANGTGGLAVWSLKDPAHPRWIAQVTVPQLKAMIPPGEAMTQFWEGENMTVDSRRKLVFLSRDTGTKGLFVIDLQDPWHPQPLGFQGTPQGHTSTCLNDCRFIWSVGGVARNLGGAAKATAVSVTDIRDPLHPFTYPETIASNVARDGVSSRRSTHSVDVDFNGVAWVSGSSGVRGYWTEGLHKDPATGQDRYAAPYDPIPYAGGSVTGNESAFLHNAYHFPNALGDRPAGDVMLITNEANSTDCSTAGVFIIASLAGTYDADGGTSSATKMNRLATFSVNGQPGQFHDALPTGNPPPDDKLQIGDCSAHWFTVKGNIVALGNYEQGTRFVDISDPRNPQQVGWFRVPVRAAAGNTPAIVSSDTSAAYWHGHYVYVSDYQRGIDILHFDGVKGEPTPKVCWNSCADNQTVETWKTSKDGSAGGTVPATLSLTLGAPASFAGFTPGVGKDYSAQTTANVISTAGDAALSYSDPGHLANGAFALPQPLVVVLSKSAWTGPASNDPVTIGFKQRIDANDALRTGTYSKTLTFTLSTTTP